MVSYPGNGVLALNENSPKKGKQTADYIMSEQNNALLSQFHEINLF